MSRATFSGNLVDNLWYNNPIFVQILGICSTLAVTNNLTNTAIMTVAVTGVTAMSNLVISLIRDFIPRKVRMIVQTVVIAFWVIVVDILLRAYFFEVSKTLGPYVGLIITNCIIMGRAEAFAQSQGVFISFWDGITSGLGYMGVLMAIAFVRELMGFGTLFGIEILPLTLDGGWFEPWTIMITAPSAFFLLGVFIWGAKAIQAKQGVQA